MSIEIADIVLRAGRDSTGDVRLTLAFHATNNGPRTTRQVEFAIAFTDADGDLIPLQAGDAFLDHLDPGETRAVSVFAEVEIEMPEVFGVEISVARLEPVRDVHRVDLTLKGPMPDIWGDYEDDDEDDDD